MRASWASGSGERRRRRTLTGRPSCGASECGEAPASATRGASASGGRPRARGCVRGAPGSAERPPPRWPRSREGGGPGAPPAVAPLPCTPGPRSSQHAARGRAWTPLHGHRRDETGLPRLVSPPLGLPPRFTARRTPGRPPRRPLPGRRAGPGPPRLPQRPGRPRPRPSACSLRPRHAALPDGYRVPSGGAAPGNRVGRETTRPAGRSGQGASRRIAVSGHACVSGPAGLLPPLPRLLPTQGRCARRSLVPPRRACGAGGEALPLPADLPIRPWLQRRFIRKPLRAPEPLTPHPVPSLRAPAPRQLCSWGSAGLCTAGPRKLPGGGVGESRGGAPANA